MDTKAADTHAAFYRSREAFLRDLPTLLANPKYDRWSAVYVGDERIALVKTLDEATRICRSARTAGRGLFYRLRDASGGG